MKSFLFPVAAIGAMILIAGCSKDEGTKTGPKFGDPTEINLVLTNPVTRGFTGKEDGEGDENLITSLELYVFSADGSTPDPEVGDGNGYVKIDNGNLTQRIRVSTGTGLQFLVIANSDIGEPGVGETLDDIKAKPTKKSFPAIDGSGSTPVDIPEKGFEMSGHNTANVVSGNNNQVYVTLYRTVGKVNCPTFEDDIPVEFKQQSQIDEIWDPQFGVDTNSEITFTFKGYSVINGLSHSDMFFIGTDDGDYKDPEGNPWENWSKAGKTRIGSTFNSTTGQYTYNYSGKSAVNTNSWFLTETEGPVYVYESMPEDMSSSAVSGYDPKTVISYIIEGELEADVVGAPVATRYWRVDITKEVDFHIMRNVVYKVKINKISTPGYGSPKDAEDPDRPVPGDEVTTDFVIDIAQWDINEYETDM